MPEEPLQTTFVAPSRWAPPTFGAFPPIAAMGAPAFHAGAAIGRALGAWWRHVIPFTFLSLVSVLPLSVGLFALGGAMERFSQGGRPAPEAFIASMVEFAVTWGLTMALQVVLAGAVSWATFRHLRGQRVGLGAMLREALRRFLPAAVAGLVAGVAVTFGLMMLVVPGVLIACMWAAAIPAVVVERAGPIQALSRSSDLTRGARWQIFVTFLALFAITWAVSFALQMISTVVVVAALPPGGAQAPFVSMAVSQLGSALSGALPLTGSAVVYHDLRAAREGLDAGQLAAVFE